jgi:hypothetical protein
MIKPVLLINLVLWCLAISVQSQVNVTGQKAPFEKGYIYMKDGSVIKGKYLYSSDMDKIRIISGKESRILDASDVEKIADKKPHYKATGNELSEAFIQTPGKWFNLTEAGILAGNPDNKQSTPFIFHSSLNYLFQKNISVGAGIGVEFFKETYLPVTANLMYRFNSKGLVPFVTLQAGYLIPIENKTTSYQNMFPRDYLSSYWVMPNYQGELDSKGGFMINPAAGILFQTNHGFGISLSCGYRYHRLVYSGNTDYKLNADYNRLSFKLGILFY